jgi:hypothetical protein
MVCKAQYHSTKEKVKREREQMYKERLPKKDVKCTCTLCGEKFNAESRYHLYCYHCKTTGRVERYSDHVETFKLCL